MEVTPAMGPWELPETRGGMSRRNRRYFTLARRAPLLSRGGLLAVGRDGPGRAGWRPRPAPAAVVQGPAAADREVLAEVTANPQRWARFIDDTAEAFRQGGG
jgi:hypothetical protein